MNVNTGDLISFIFFFLLHVAHAVSLGIFSFFKVSEKKQKACLGIPVICFFGIIFMCIQYALGINRAAISFGIFFGFVANLLAILVFAIWHFFQSKKVHEASPFSKNARMGLLILILLTTFAGEMIIKDFSKYAIIKVQDDYFINFAFASDKSNVAIVAVDLCGKKHYYKVTSDKQNLVLKKIKETTNLDFQQDDAVMLLFIKGSVFITINENEFAVEDKETRVKLKNLFK